MAKPGRCCQDKWAGYELERDLLNERLAQVTEQLESRLHGLKKEYRSADLLPSGAREQTFRYEAERKLIESLLSEESRVSLHDRLLQRIREKEEQKIEQIRQALATEGYPQHFWSDELYVQLLRDLLDGWQTEHSDSIGAV